jgi:hypothetical protein
MMIRLMLLCIAASAVLVGCGGSRHASRNFMIQDTYDPYSAEPPAPNYADPINWAALPDRKDAADTTPGKQYIDVQDSAAVDVFFVHPTTFTYEPAAGGYKWNADVTDSALNARTDASTILYQASVFNGACKIYAPRYRQAHITVFFSKDTATYFGPLAVAYNDIKDAFAYYLEHYNNGRPFIIASHSQGTVHARRLIHDVIEQDSSLNSRLVAAYLVGYAVVSDSFVKLKPCRTPTETHCYCTWNTFATGYFPPWYNDGLFKAVATNPLTWTTDTTYASWRLNKGGVLQDLSKVVPGVVDAKTHAGMVWINKPRVRGAALLRVKNYHIGDYNLFYINIRENVQQRVHAHFQRTGSLR